MAPNENEQEQPEAALQSMVPSVSTFCALCRQPLIQSSTTGGCLRCMAKLVWSEKDEALDTVGAMEELRRYLHFEIALRADGSLDELGHGAMGTTYRAMDTVLQSPVALKIIGRNVADSPAVRARFLREARVAAKLRHPNVASVFHYGEQQGECFLVMELVEGETLEERVRRDGPLPAPTVLEIGFQVACALTAAEAQHLVHRDIKPGNLMWVANPQLGKPDDPLLVKVIDFGLAKALTSDADATGESDTRHGFTGTPAYASPEQFARTADHPVDTRSDLYSLGATLWYLLCGRTPFRGATLEEIHRQQTRQPLPVDQLTTRRVPWSVIALLRSLLAVDPRQRPQSVREFIEVLKRCQAVISPARRRRSKWLWSAAVALLASGILAASFLVSARKGKDRAPLSSATIDRSLAVLPFENLSPDPSEAFLAVATQDVITASLARVKEIKVIGADSTRDYPPGHRDLAKIGHELGVRFVLEGSALRRNDQMQIVTRLVDVQDGKPIWSKEYRGGVADTFSIQREITLEVSSRLQAALTPNEKTAVSQPPTTDPIAYDLYLRVVADPKWFPDETATRQRLLEYAALLEKAVARDPRFTLAYCMLAGEYDDLADHQVDLPVEQRKLDYRQMAEKALAEAQRLQPDAGEVHLALANHYLLVERENDRAAREVALARQTLPNDAGVEYVAGSVARRQNRWDEAIRCFERGTVLEPRNSDLYGILMETYRIRRMYPEFDRTVARLIAVVPPAQIGPLTLEGSESALLGYADTRPEHAARAAQGADDSLTELDKVLTDIELAVCDRDADALRRVLAASPRDSFPLVGVAYPKAYFEGFAAWMSGDTAGARTAFAAARPEVEKAVLASPKNSDALGLLALIDAGLGRRDEAVSEARRACELVMPYEKNPMFAGAARCNLGAVYGWTGQPDLAFVELNAAIDVGVASNGLIGQPTYGDFRLNPLWDPLRDDPRFAALVARLAPPVPR